MNIGVFKSVVRLSVEIDVISLFLQIEAIETNKNVSQQQIISKVTKNMNPGMSIRHLSHKSFKEGKSQEKSQINSYIKIFRFPNMPSTLEHLTSFSSLCKRQINLIRFNTCSKAQLPCQASYWKFQVSKVNFQWNVNRLWCMVEYWRFHIFCQTIGRNWCYQSFSPDWFN